MGSPCNLIGAHFERRLLEKVFYEPVSRAPEHCLLIRSESFARLMGIQFNGQRCWPTQRCVDRDQCPGCLPQFGCQDRNKRIALTLRCNQACPVDPHTAVLKVAKCVAKVLEVRGCIEPNQEQRPTPPPPPLQGRYPPKSPETVPAPPPGPPQFPAQSHPAQAGCRNRRATHP